MKQTTLPQRGVPSVALGILLTVLLVFVVGQAWAQPEPPAPVAPTTSTAPVSSRSWAWQLEELVRWSNQRSASEGCKERCFALQRLRLTGDLTDGPLTFVLEGGVLTDGSFAVPLFGPAHRVVLSKVTENGKPASIGFDGDTYFLHTSAKRFVLEGTIQLHGELALAIPGPLNLLETELGQGRVVEGDTLSGLRDTTVHFDTSSGEAPAAGPAVFQLARAVRVGRETQFEYRLVLRSGTELGVVRLPLPYGEKVLDVQGAPGWSVDEQALLLPTSGRAAQVTITGSLPKVGKFSTDDRSSYEWWLFEADPEHRLSVTGDGRQVDASESPIQRSQPTARLYLLNKGQSVDVTVQTLSSTEVLAAIVRLHRRTVVFTRKGDVVADDTLSYENNGIDYLLYGTEARPIYLATDGAAERIMHREDNRSEVMVPLRTGKHDARVQSLTSATLSWLGGTLTVPMGSYPLTASRAQLTVGLPAEIIPLAVLGGDEPHLAVGVGDGIAVLIAFAAAWVVLRTRRRRWAGAAVLSGLWFLSGPIFVIVIGCMAMVGLIWVLTRLLSGAKLVSALVSLIIVGVVATFIAAIGVLTLGRSADSMSPSSAPAAYEASSIDRGGRKVDADRTGNWMAQNAEGGVLEGVTPVALPLPRYDRSVSVSRELVTQQRPLVPRIYYATPWSLAPLGLLWLALAGWLVFAHRDHLRRARDWVRARFQKRAPIPAGPPVPSGPESEQTTESEPPPRPRVPPHD
jgi:hypothetical protein